MNILIINPIIYTQETANIKKVSSIKDCMICDLCSAFSELGCNVTLAASDLFAPTNQESYSFDIVWFESCYPQLFKPNCFPLLKGLKSYLKNNLNHYDLVISSEVFSVNTLIAYRVFKDKLVVWHELAKHNAIFHQLPSKFWYNVIARFFMKNARVVARSYEARDFISAFVDNVSSDIIEHGVNLEAFQVAPETKNQFIVCSQLIPRKQIDRIIAIFARYLNKYDRSTTLYIVGDGELKEPLQLQAASLSIVDNVVFTGQLSHAELLPLLSESMAFLVNTRKDNNMISVIESIACGVPVLTSEVPYNASYIKSHALGIAKNNWNEDDLRLIVEKQDFYRRSCLEYRDSLSMVKKAESFIKLIGKRTGETCIRSHM